MADYFSSTSVKQLTSRKGKPWQGILIYRKPNPDYVPDPREPNQRRKSLRGKLDPETGKRSKPNPDYVPDPREPNQQNPTIEARVTKVFDPNTVRTKTQANKELVKWREQMEALHAAPDAGLSVWKYIEQYIAMRERAGMQRSTVRDYRGTMRYLKRGEAIDETPLRDLTPHMVEAWEASLSDAGLSGTTCLKAHRLLKQVCKYAVEVDDLQKTPVRGFKAPSRSTGKPNSLDADGRMKAMVALSELPTTPLRVAAELALYTGMRRAEMCALTWGNVDLIGVAWDGTRERGPKLRVVQSLGEADRGTFLKEPKTERGKRVIPLYGDVLDVLKDRRSRMWAEWSARMIEAGLKPTVREFSKLYVIGTIDGKHAPMDTITHQWNRFATDHNLIGTRGKVVTLHALRHSYATNAITRGVDVATVADVLGHEQISTTLNMYTDHDNAAKRRAMEAVASDLDMGRTGKVLSFHPHHTGTEG